MDWTSYPTIRDWREQSKSFEDMAAILRPEGSEVILQSDAGHERIQGSKVSGNFFEMLGVSPCSDALSLTTRRGAAMTWSC